MADTSLVIVLDAQLPFIRHPDVPGCVEESWFFNAVSYTYLPLLRVCTALETEGVPFKLAIAFAPTLCEMLADPLLQERYLAYLDRSLDFGLAELERNARSPGIRELIQAQLDQIRLNRRDFEEIYERNILRKFDYFATHGYIEILATTATACYLPLYADIPESVNAQIETGLIVYRKHFTAIPNGFWLPGMAWSHGLDQVLKAYGFQYTLVDAHGLLFADPPPDTGIFAPAACENGFAVFARDKGACDEVLSPERGFQLNPVYLDTERDIGFDLDEKHLSRLFDVNLGRRITGFRYYARGTKDNRTAAYQATAAQNQLRADVEEFLDRRVVVLGKASGLLEGAPVTITCAFPASFFGQSWFEGVSWIEELFRNGANRPELSFSLPSVRAGKPGEATGRHIVPYCSSWSESGYAEEVLNNSNDWMYPYIRKATLRMIDLAERFPDDNGLKERALNMAARELLLAQSMDWFIMMNDRDRSEYARRRFEESVRAFTVVYESLGSNFISTEWLTKIEKIDNLFPEINYRVFSRKK